MTIEEWIEAIKPRIVEMVVERAFDATLFSTEHAGVLVDEDIAPLLKRSLFSMDNDPVTVDVETSEDGTHTVEVLGMIVGETLYRLVKP